MLSRKAAASRLCSPRVASGPGTAPGKGPRVAVQGLVPNPAVAFRLSKPRPAVWCISQVPHLKSRMMKVPSRRVAVRTRGDDTGDLSAENLRRGLVRAVGASPGLRRDARRWCRDRGVSTARLWANHLPPILSSLQAERRRRELSAGQSSASCVAGLFDEDFLMVFDEDDKTVVELSNWAGCWRSPTKASLFPRGEATCHSGSDVRPAQPGVPPDGGTGGFSVAPRTRLPESK